MLLMALSFSGYSRHDNAKDFYKVDSTHKRTEFQDKDLQKAYDNFDTTRQVVKYIGNTLKEEVKTYGLKQTIRMNSPIFLPITILFVMFLIWLKSRTKV